MKTIQNIKSIILLFALLLTFCATAQVAIGKTYLDSGAIFQVESPDNDKGMMIPRVELSSRTDTSTIHGTEENGLWVYNTNSGGSGNDRVSPGFYFWQDGEWIKVYNNGYSEQFFQTVGVKAADQTTTYTFPGLDQDVTIPFTGTYQIIVVGNYAAGLRSTGSTEGVGYASISLEIDNSKVEEAFVTSTSKRTGTGTFHALGQNVNIIYNVDLVAGTTYNFKVRGREWQQINTYNTFLSGTYGNGYGIWGIDSSYYDGNSGGDPDCQDNYLTITLLREF